MSLYIQLIKLPKSMLNLRMFKKEKLKNFRLKIRWISFFFINMLSLEIIGRFKSAEIKPRSSHGP